MTFQANTNNMSSMDSSYEQHSGSDSESCFSEDSERYSRTRKTFQLPLRMKTKKTKKGSVNRKGYRFRVDKKRAKEARSKEKTKRFFHKKDTKGSEDEVVATLIEEQEEIDRQWDAFCYYHYYYDRINDMRNLNPQNR